MAEVIEILSDKSDDEDLLINTFSTPEAKRPRSDDNDDDDVVFLGSKITEGLVGNNNANLGKRIKFEPDNNSSSQASHNDDDYMSNLDVEEDTKYENADSSSNQISCDEDDNAYTLPYSNQDCKTDIKFDPTDKPNQSSYYDDDKTLPYNQTGRSKPFKPADVVEILLFKSGKQCSNVPSKVMQNASFVIDIDKLGGVDDMKADELGVWIHLGSPTSYIEIEEDDDGDIQQISSTRRPKRDAFRLLTKQYKHSDLTSSYRRRISYLYNASGEMHKLALLQYYFEDRIVKKVKIPKHGNSKSDASFIRTKPSKLQDMKESIRQGISPKDAFFKACEKEGGVKEAKSISFLPRNVKQLKNCKSSQKITFCSSNIQQRDTLLEAMEACKGKSSIAKETVGAPEPMTFLANERQLKDLELYCLGDGDVSVLGVDPTFNLGEFFVTFTTYRALKVVSLATGKSPIFIGPSLIHKSKEQKSYAYLASSITRHNPKLADLKAFGTDGEEALKKAFKQYFPKATHFRCAIHMRRNINGKLSDIGIKGKDQGRFIDDIFGNERDHIQKDGLVSATGPEDFLVKLESLEEHWNEAELNLTGNPPKFFYWFVKNISDNMQETMLTDKRGVAGLEASLYSTNDNESINALIKKKVKFQKSNLIDFINTVDQVVQEQDVVLENAICGVGDYRLQDKYKYLELPQDKWRRMTPAQRKQYLKSAKEKGSCQRVLSSLSVKADASGITSIPKAILENSCKKASLLLRENKVMKGFKDDTLLVQSESQDKPRIVHVRANGRFECDKDCPGYKHSSLCSNILAAAEFKGSLPAFLAWYRGSQNGTNATRLVDHGFERVGKKPGQRVGKRTNENNGNAPLTMKITKTGGEYTVTTGADDDSFNLVFLADHPRVKVCTGCKVNFARDEDGRPFPPPHDLAVSYKESRPFVDKNSGNLRSGRIQAAYFHTNVDCIRKGYGKANSHFSVGDLFIDDKCKKGWAMYTWSF